jgi:hypothetical protein
MNGPEDIRSLARDKVLAAERPAWAMRRRMRHFFDGRQFWVTEAGEQFAVSADDTPSHGWRHREGCSCASCRSMNDQE